ncbi:hypothetical protein Tco_0293077, partial [Tanacetum coccineum]
KGVLEDFKGAISSVLPERHAQESLCKVRRHMRRRHRVTKHEQGSTMEEAKGESTIYMKACYGRDLVMLKRIHDEDVASLGGGGCHDLRGGEGLENLWKVLEGLENLWKVLEVLETLDASTHESL